METPGITLNARVEGTNPASIFKRRPIILLASLFAIIITRQSTYLFNKAYDLNNPRYSDSIIRESNLTTIEFIRTNGYPAEEHVVKTGDGYNIVVHRIPPNVKINASSHQTPIPVLLVHGVFCTSAVWVINMPENSLGFILHDAGYDVWMTNRRGNIYSRNHEKWSPSEKQFWNFSIDNTALIDLAATVDYVLHTSGAPRLLLVSHSLGTVESFALLAEKPQYNEKVLAYLALSPAAHIEVVKGYMGVFVQNFGTVKALTDFLGIYDMDRRHWMFRIPETLFCFWKFGSFECDFMFTAVESDPKNVNQTRIPIYESEQTKYGVSMTVLTHLYQIVQTKLFAHYDYGSPESNTLAYGTPNSPSYDLSLVSTPVTIFCSEGDILCDPQNVKWYSEQLPKFTNFNIADRNFGHADYIFGLGARKFLYDPILKLFANLTNSEKILPL